MKKLMVFYVLFFTVFMVNVAVAQTDSKSSPQSRKYIYTYTFENASSEDLVQKTQTELNTLIHVSTVKYVFKAESQKGQFIITVIENDRTSESEELFSPKLIKDSMLQNGLSPMEFTVTEEIIK
jgi:hypothetical protein